MRRDFHAARLLLLALQLIFNHPLTYGEENLRLLYRYLVQDYDREVRPSLRHDIPIRVTFAFSLTQIIDVDERNQILTTNAWVRQHWIDYKLVWDPRYFGNLTKIHIPYEKIWRPDIILYNNADSQYTKSVMSTDVVVNYLGNVTWASAAIFKSSCPLDVRYYPFDTQRCVLKFASWAYDGTKIDLIISTENGDKSNYMISTEWQLLDIRAMKDVITYSCCPEPYPFVDVSISIERRPMFYVFNLILPCVLISGIALLGFYMPSDSGEKVTLGITSLLSTTVFLMLVAEGMPPTSEALPLIGIYYGVTIFIVSLATAMTVFTLNVHHYGIHGSRVPPLLMTFAFRYLARLLMIRLPPYHSINGHVKYLYEQENPRCKNMIEQLSFPSSLATSPTALAPPARKANGNGRLKMVSFSAASSPEGAEEELSESFPTVLTHNSQQGIAAAAAAAAARKELCGGHDDVFEGEFLHIMRMVHAAIERSEMRQAEKDRREGTRLEWEQVAMVLDRFLLIVFIVSTASISFSILYQRQLGLFV